MYSPSPLDVFIRQVIQALMDGSVSSFVSSPGVSLGNLFFPQVRLILTESIPSLLHRLS